MSKVEYYGRISQSHGDDGFNFEFLYKKQNGIYYYWAIGLFDKIPQWHTSTVTVNLKKIKRLKITELYSFKVEEDNLKWRHIRLENTKLYKEIM